MVNFKAARKFARDACTLIALVLPLAATSGCSECQTYLDCSGEGFQACFDGACVEVPVDDGAVCEQASECGDQGKWACSDGHCAPTPSCQHLDGPFNYAAACTTLGSVKGTAQATTRDCVPSVSLTGAVNTTIAVATLSASGPLAITGVQTGGTCVAGTFSSLDSTMSLPGCSIGTDTCDVVLRAVSRAGLPCVVGAVNGCPDGGTCTTLTTAPGAGVCR